MITNTRMDAVVSALDDIAQIHQARRRQASAKRVANADRVRQALARGRHAGGEPTLMSTTNSSEPLVIEPRRRPLEPLHVRQGGSARRQVPVQQPAKARVAIGDRATLAKAARARLAARKGTSEDTTYSKVYAQPAGPAALSKTQDATYAKLFGNQNTAVKLTAAEQALFNKITTGGERTNV